MPRIMVYHWVVNTTCSHHNILMVLRDRMRNEGKLKEMWYLDEDGGGGGRDSVSHVRPKLAVAVGHASQRITGETVQTCHTRLPFVSPV